MGNVAVSKLWAAVGVAALMLAGCTAVVDEQSLIRPVRGPPTTLAQLQQRLPGYTAEERVVRAGDGAALYTLTLHRPGARRTVLYFGGNGFVVSEHAPLVARWLAPLDVNIVLVDHRGYGRSEGTPTLELMRSDALAVFDDLTARPESRAATVVVHGQSLGSFVAGWVAAQRRVRGVVLESTATTAEDWVATSERPFYARLFRVEVDGALRGQGNLDNVRRLDEPLLLLSGARDGTTPTSMAEALRVAAPPAASARLAIVPAAGHNDVLEHPEAIEAYRAFLASLDQ